MSILSGSLTCRCFRVGGRPPANYRETYPRQIQRHAFHPPQPEKGQMRSAGWVNPRRILETRMDLDELIVGGRLILALRADAIVLNSRLYKARLSMEMARWRRETGRERLTRDEKLALEERLQMEMAKSQSASTAIQEMAWNFKTGEALFTATSDKACLEFQEIFTSTFDLPIEPLLPYLRAERIARRLGRESELASAMPAILSPSGAEGEPGSAGPRIIQVESE